MGYQGMPSAPFDSTLGGRSVKIRSPSFVKKMTRFGWLWVVGVGDLLARGNTLCFFDNTTNIVFPQWSLYVNEVEEILICYYM